ncbi:hypothetical protein HI914_02149 [Erysiphe necator]|nr:hypothetical protein HI914_02149 [Erysiphe necator]
MLVFSMSSSFGHLYSLFSTCLSLDFIARVFLCRDLFVRIGVKLEINLLLRKIVIIFVLTLMIRVEADEINSSDIV